MASAGNNDQHAVAEWAGATAAALLRRAMAVGAVGAAPRVTATGAVGTTPTTVTVNGQPSPPPLPQIASLDAAVDEALATERVSRKRVYDEIDEEEQDAEEAAERDRIVRAVRQRREPYKIKCVLCSYGDPAFDAVSKDGCRPFGNLVNMAKRANINNREDMRRMANYYAEQLYVPSLRTSRPLPQQTPDHFREHLRRHTHNPVFQIMDLQDQVFNALEYNRLMFRYDKKGSAKLAQLGDLARKLITIPRTGTFFGQHMDPLSIDPATLGDVANTEAMRAFLAKRHDALGGATATDTDATTRGHVFPGPTQASEDIPI